MCPCLCTTRQWWPPSPPALTCFFLGVGKGRGSGKPCTLSLLGSLPSCPFPDGKTHLHDRGCEQPRLTAGRGPVSPSHRHGESTADTANASSVSVIYSASKLGRPDKYGCAVKSEFQKNNEYSFSIIMSQILHGIYTKNSVTELKSKFNQECCTVHLLNLTSLFRKLLTFTCSSFQSTILGCWSHGLPQQSVWLGVYSPSPVLRQ